jgi:hypothetical protein
MNIYLAYLIYFPSIFIVEVIVGCIIGIFYSSLEVNRISFYFIHDLQYYITLSFGRLKYHYAIHIPLTILILKYFPHDKEYNNNSLTLGIINTLSYIFILSLYGITVNKDIWQILQKSVTYFYAISLFFCPFILYRIPFYREVIKAL